MAAEDVEPEPTGSFGHGIAVGIAICAALVHIAFVGMTGDWQKLYADLRAPLPLLTRISISVPWQLGVPVVGAVALGLLILRRPRGLGWYIAVAVALLAAAACTFYFPSAPLGALAGNIAAD